MIHDWIKRNLFFLRKIFFLVFSSRIKPLDSQNLRWNERDFLGAGTFGNVYKGTYNDQGEHKRVAIKVLKTVDISNDKEFQRETSALSCLNHHNIIRFYGICEINLEPSKWSIVMEFANLGTLFDHFQNDNLTPSHASKACLDMYHGLQYLHSKDYVHRDMKMENILLVGNLERGFRAKIADFGFSRRTTTQIMSAYCGSWNYMAPELAQDSVQYNYKVDVYSSSIIVFEVFTKQRFPFPDGNPMQKLQAIRRSDKPQIPAYIPRTLQTLIAKGWSRQPQERPEVYKFIEAFEELIETYSNMGDLPENTVQINTQNQAQSIRKEIFSGAIVFAFQWDPDLEEGNSRQLRTKMLDDIKKNYSQAAQILPSVLTSLENVPKHTFMDADKTPGSNRSQKIERIYTWDRCMKLVGNAAVGHSGYLGLCLSMLKIDVGLDVLVIGARGYIESLVSQLVGPQGKVTVVDTSKTRIDEFRTLMRQIAPGKNIAYHHVNNYEISGMLNKV